MHNIGSRTSTLHTSAMALCYSVASFSYVVCGPDFVSLSWEVMLCGWYVTMKLLSLKFRLYHLITAV